jgi:hypothetical protein
MTVNDLMQIKCTAPGVTFNYTFCPQKRGNLRIYLAVKAFAKFMQRIAPITITETHEGS